jgi:hypothetical protein
MEGKNRLRIYNFIFLLMEKKETSNGIRKNKGMNV